MKKKLDILFRLLAKLPPLAGRAGVGSLICVLLLTACSHDDILPAESDTEGETPYVELLIAVPYANSLTRGNPMGGEEGNGREQGALNEDKIHDVNVFFYIGEADMNSDGTTPIVHSIYYNLDNSSDPLNSKLEVDEDKKDQPYYSRQYLTLKFRCEEDLMNQAKSNNLKFLVIANIGPITKPNNLGALRNLQLDYYSNAWTKSYDAGSMNAEKMDYFIMSTAYSQNYTYSGDASGWHETGDNTIQKNSNDEYIGITTLQRLYARLDLWYKEEENLIETTSTNAKGETVEKVKELKYKIIDKDNKVVEGNYVYLTNVLPVNVMQTPSYLFKKVTDGLTSFSTSDFNSWTEKYKWGGKETPDGSTSTVTISTDRPTNYVMEPHTLEKTAGGGTDAATLETWYKNTRASVVGDNTTGAENGKGIKNPAMGVLKQYYDMRREAAGNDPTDYGCNHISIISYANENTHPTDCFHSNYLTGMAFRAVYVPANIYSGYTETTTTTTDGDGNSSTVTAKTLQELDQTVTEITGGKIYRYSPTSEYNNEIQKPNPELQLESKSLYFTNETDAKNYAEDHPKDMGIITSYNAEKHGDKWGFICYYNLWLRHYNNENPEVPQENYPMEYATVRNNIYRVAVDFSGPGDPTPTMREPDTMKARIFVRKWNYRMEDELIFEL